MRKVRISEFDMQVMINGLFITKNRYCAETQVEIDTVINQLYAIHKSMKINKSKRIMLEPKTKKLIFHCLNDWRNMLLDNDEYDAALEVGEKMLILYK